MGNLEIGEEVIFGGWWMCEGSLRQGDCPDVYGEEMGQVRGSVGAVFDLIGA